MVMSHLCGGKGFMLTSFEKDVISIINAALSGGAPTLSGELDLRRLYGFSKAMQITPLIVAGLEHTSGAFDSDDGKRLVKSAVAYSFYSEMQDYEITTIKKHFDAAGIEYLLLKGTVLRSIYPRKEMRLMSDADILIKEEQYAKISDIMTSLGYTEKLESDHELVWNKDGKVHIELHKRLVPSYNKDYYAYFGDGWRLATVRDGSEWKMSPEDCFVYIFVHYAKHYRDGGIGVKHVCDFYLYMNKYPSLDWKYIEKELSSLQLLRFWQNTKKLIDVWFGGYECDEKSAFLTHKIFSGNAYGTAEAHLLSQGLKISKKSKNVRMKRLFMSIFPSYSTMQQKYRFLRKAPFLLPFAWGCRWISILFHPKKFAEQKKKMQTLSNENITSYQNELDYVGIDFNFE